MTRKATSRLAILTVLAALASTAVAPAQTVVAPVDWEHAGVYGPYYPWDFRPPCQFHYYYACWADPYGRPQCGCRPGLGFYLNRY